MMGYIKICGLKTEDDVEVALDAGADAVGFVVFPASPRHLPLKRASELTVHARGRADAVVLMVDPPAEAFLLTRKFPIDIVQYHGTEDPADIAKAAKTFGLRAWKAFGVERRDDLAQAFRYGAQAERFVIDAKPPEEADRPGGHGAPFDWTILKDWTSPKPWLLAGGLTPENVAEAIKATGAQGVDVSSGVEAEKGVKDHARIRDFVQAARAAFAELETG